MRISNVRFSQRIRRHILNPTESEKGCGRGKRRDVEEGGGNERRLEWRLQIANVGREGA